MEKIFSGLIISAYLIGFAIFAPCASALESITITPKKISMGTVVLADYQQGFKERQRAAVMIVGNNKNAWKVMAKTNDSNMGTVGSYTKSINDFLWRATGTYATQTSYTSIKNYDVEVARGPIGSGMATYIDSEILLSWIKDCPGQYNITITFTLTTQ